MANPFREIFAPKEERRIEHLFDREGAVPFSKSVLFSVQHFLALFVSNIAPIIVLVATVTTSTPEIDALVLENGIRTAIFMAGLGALLQLFPLLIFGSGLPNFMGSSFTFIGCMALIVSAYSWQTMFISVMIGGAFLAFVGYFAKYWAKWIKPIVSAIVVLALGLSLLPVAIKQFVGMSDVPGLEYFYDWSVGWKYLLVAIITLVSSITFQCFAKGIWKNMSIVVALVVGYVAALCIPGMVNFSQLSFSQVTDFINVPRPVFTFMSFSASDINIGAILTMSVLFLVSSTETIGALTYITQSLHNRDANPKEIAGGIASVGLLGGITGLFGGVPLTSYLQNAGIVAKSKVVNRNALLLAPIAFMFLSLFPPIASLFRTIPSAVFGGIMVNLFGGITYSGMKMVLDCPRNEKNTLIAALSLSIGYGLTLLPSFTEPQFGNDILNSLMLIIQSPVVTAFVISLLLSYVIPERINDKNSEENDIR